MAARRRSTRKRRRTPLTPEQELAAIEKRAAELRELIKLRRHFSPEAVRRHRHCLGLSATEYGNLLGASMQTIYGWEKGRSRGRPDLIARWVALTKKT